MLLEKKHIKRSFSPSDKEMPKLSRNDCTKTLFRATGYHDTLEIYGGKE